MPTQLWDAEGDFEVYADSDYLVPFDFSPENFTGSTLRLDVLRADGSVAATLTTGNGGIVWVSQAGGTFHIKVARNSIAVGKYTHTLWLVSGSDNYPLIHGYFTVKSRPPLT